ncbi:hypothetical protein CW705_02620 [Candidatus Bathyarchaeota archaeon]|nr:MAG: hypothetical protein CW705_02620 [Candidatus Bathyarchaeota archaeon]
MDSGGLKASRILTVKKKAPPYTSKLVIERNLDKLPLSSDRVLSVVLEKDGDAIYEDTKTV